MPQSFSNHWVHCIWRTKNSRKILLKSFRFKLFRHMKKYAQDNDILLDIINGVEDHVHCLIRLKTTQCVADVIGIIKGEASFWINRNVILDEHFKWQAGFGVVSVSPTEISRIRKYIYNQEEHDKNKSLPKELNEIKFTKFLDKPSISQSRQH